MVRIVCGKRHMLSSVVYEKQLNMNSLASNVTEGNHSGQICCNMFEIEYVYNQRITGSYPNHNRKRDVHNLKQTRKINLDFFAWWIHFMRQQSYLISATRLPGALISVGGSSFWCLSCISIHRKDNNHTGLFIKRNFCFQWINYPKLLTFIYLQSTLVVLKQSDSPWNLSVHMAD